jgi:transposase InsO family protein
VDEKIELVVRYRHQFGLNACVRAVGLSKGTWHHRQHRPDPSRRDQALRADLRAIIQEHPGYGYRPLQVELAEAGKGPVNHKRLLRVLQRYELGLPRCLPAATPSGVHRLIRQAGCSVNLVHRRSFAVLEAFTTDFTELVYAGGAHKAHLIALLDLQSHWAGGWAVGPSGNHVLALTALDDLGEQLKALQRSLQDVIIHHDQDAVFTSHAWLRRLLLTEGARVSYTEHGCRDNPWTESFWGRLKTEIDAAIRDAETMAELTVLVAQRMTYYNQRRRHSSLGYVAPWTFLRRALGRRDGN